MVEREEKLINVAMSNTLGVYISVTYSCKTDL